MTDSSPYVRRGLEKMKLNKHESVYVWSWGKWSGMNREDRTKLERQNSGIRRSIQSHNYFQLLQASWKEITFTMSWLSAYGTFISASTVPHRGETVAVVMVRVFLQLTVIVGPQLLKWSREGEKQINKRKTQDRDRRMKSPKCIRDEYGGKNGSSLWTSFRRWLSTMNSHIVEAQTCYVNLSFIETLRRTLLDLQSDIYLILRFT